MLVVACLFVVGVFLVGVLFLFWGFRVSCSMVSRSCSISLACLGGFCVGSIEACKPNISALNV